VLAALLLAAGKGTRFGGAKLMAPLEGRPMIVHVLEALAVARPGGRPLHQVIVVSGYHADMVEAVAGVARAGRRDTVRLVRNPRPERGLSSSISAGLGALDSSIGACFLVLGDQPRLSPKVLEALAERWAMGGASIVVPRYSGGGGSNPVLLDRRAWPLAAGLDGDTGLRTVIAAHPELVDTLDVPGANPDVDTEADLAALAGTDRSGDHGPAADEVAPRTRRTTLDTAPHVQAEDRATWRAWLEANHAIEPGAWLVTWRPGSGMPTLDYEAAVEEALCFGWIDSTGGRVDEHRRKLYFARRKPRSVWAASNKARVERLIEAGKMTPAGLASIELAKANGSWDVLDSSDRLEVPEDLRAAFDADPAAAGHWAGYPASLRKQLLGWIAVARRPATRAARVAEVARLAAGNERPRGWRREE
jgi:CTP:molybdopterin cytidylyltransferase MocA/uncharacterized protein YdeI (YjbR/CyaY-like superfamily)